MMTLSRISPSKRKDKTKNISLRKFCDKTKWLQREFNKMNSWVLVLDSFKKKTSKVYKKEKNLFFSVFLAKISCSSILSFSGTVVQSCADFVRSVRQIAVYRKLLRSNLRRFCLRFLFSTLFLDIIAHIISHDPAGRSSPCRTSPEAHLSGDVASL